MRQHIVRMLYPLAESTYFPTRGYNIHTYTRYAAASLHNKVINILIYNFSKEQCTFPEDDLRIETCRSVLNVLV